MSTQREVIIIINAKKENTRKTHKETKQKQPLSDLSRYDDVISLPVFSFSSAKEERVRQSSAFDFVVRSVPGRDFLELFESI